jgi:hypothetical protein
MDHPLHFAHPVFLPCMHAGDNETRDLNPYLPISISWLLGMYSIVARDNGPNAHL